MRCSSASLDLMHVSSAPGVFLTVFQFFLQSHFHRLPTIGHMGVALAEPGLFAQPLSTHMVWESHVGNLGGENRYCCSPKPHTQNRRSRKKASPIFLEFLPQISLLPKSQPQPKLGGGISRSFSLAEKSTNHCTIACPTVNY